MVEEFLNIITIQTINLFMLARLSRVRKLPFHGRLQGMYPETLLSITLRFIKNFFKPYLVIFYVHLG